MNDVKTPFYLVAGLGKTGFSIARYLSRRHISFSVFDTRAVVPEAAKFKEEFPHTEIFSETIPDDLYQRLTALVVSPGVPLSHPVLEEAKRRHLPLMGDVECFAKEVKAPVIAITGTNGKSTVTTLIGEMAAASHFKVGVAGNIGTPVLDMLDDGNTYHLWVLELSSFQLELIDSLRPKVSVLLNITPDHLDRHIDFDNYCEMKHRIYNHADILVFNRDDEKTFPKTSSAKTIHFGLNESKEGNWGLLTKQEKTWIAYGSEPFIEIDALRLKGTHNWQNVLAAVAAAHAAGFPSEAILSVLQTFSGLPHRCQSVRILDDVEYIDDSKGTNVGATVSAIIGTGKNIDGKIVLLAGGVGKGASFDDLKSTVQYLRSVIVFGEDGPKIQETFKGLLKVTRVDSFEEAVLLAKKEALNGDVVLLSPACASFDMFKDYNARGERFVELVEGL